MLSIKARIFFGRHIKLITLFDWEKLEKLRLQKIIPLSFYGSFQDFLLDFDNSNGANELISV